MAPTPYKVQATPAAFTEWTEFNIQGLYLHRRQPSGPNANEAFIISPKGILGLTTVFNWEVYDGLGPNANLVARIHGLDVNAGSLVYSFSLVFKDKRFNWSRLEVRGTIANQWSIGEWSDELAVIGGTGQFAMADGVISSRYLEKTINGGTIELRIRAFCPQHNGTRTPYPVIKIGPSGGSGGSPMDITEAPRRLESITVHAGWIVDSIAFSYVDNSGQKHSAGPWGGSGGQRHPIELAESEVVTEVSGTVTSFEGDTVISSIKFVTNLTTHGPFGGGQGAPFTIPVQPGSAIVGFFARAGAYLDAIGVHVAPL